MSELFLYANYLLTCPRLLKLFVLILKNEKSIITNDVRFPDNGFNLSN